MPAQQGGAQTLITGPGQTVLVTGRGDVKYIPMPRFIADSALNPTGAQKSGNGGGDAYWTDGEIGIARLTKDAVKTDNPPQTLDSPQIVQWKNAVMKQLGDTFGN